MLKQFKNKVRLWLSALWKSLATRGGVTIGAEVIFNGRPSLKLVKGSSVQISDAVTLNSYGRSNPLYCNQPVSLSTLDSEACIYIGARTGVSGSSICALTSVQIGEDTLIGVGCQIFDNDFHYWNGKSWRNPAVNEAAPVVIGNRVFIGARVTILKGVQIGDGSIIGAGSVVTNDIPPNSLAAGQPAKIISKNKKERNLV